MQRERAALSYSFGLRRAWGFPRQIGHKGRVRVPVSLTTHMNQPGPQRRPESQGVTPQGPVSVSAGGGPAQAWPHAGGSSGARTQPGLHGRLPPALVAWTRQRALVRHRHFPAVQPRADERSALVACAPTHRRHQCNITKRQGRSLGASDAAQRRSRAGSHRPASSPSQPPPRRFYLVSALNYPLRLGV